MSSTQLGLLGLAVVVLAILMNLTRRRVRRAQGAVRTDVRAEYAALQGESSAGRDAEAVIYELDQLARQIHGRLDTKIAKLEAVIRDADVRIDRLSRLGRSADGLSTLDVTLERQVPDVDVAVEKQSPVSASHAAVFRLADEGRSPAEIARQVGRTIGEVELILALRRTRESSANSVRSTTSVPDAAAR